MSPHAHIEASKIGEWNEFERAFLYAVEEGLRSVLGETATAIIFLHLERDHGLKRDVLHRNVEEFSADLTGLLGSGAPLLEGLIIKLLCSRLQSEYDVKPEFGFADHVEGLRERFGGERLTEKG